MCLPSKSNGVMGSANGLAQTMKGMPRFANSWLVRANQSGGSPFAQKEQQETGRKPLKQWTQLDDLTHDFMNNERSGSHAGQVRPVRNIRGGE